MYGMPHLHKYYAWNEGIVSHATYLKWEALDLLSIEALNGAIAATQLANEALYDADVAKTLALQATDAASLANITAGDAKTAADAATAAVATMNAQINNKTFITGDIRPTLRTTGYSTSEDQGWLFADGTAVSKSIFAALYATIGGVDSGGGALFILPDLRGRTLIGAGTGAGLTARTLGGLVGVEGVALADAEIPQHKHTFGRMIDGGAPDDSDDALFLNRVGSPTIAAGLGRQVTGNGAPAETNINAVSGDFLETATQNAGTVAATAHTNMQPSAVVNYLIKT